MMEERRPPKSALHIRDIVRIGLMTALLLAAKAALNLPWLPNIELVSLFILLYTLHFGRRALFIIYIFVVAEGLIYPFGLWWVSYLYVWLILYLVVRICRANTSPLFWALISGGFGLAFGPLCAIPYLFVGGPAMVAVKLIAGIPFDIAHCIGNFLLALALFRVLDKLLKRLDP